MERITKLRRYALTSKITFKIENKTLHLTLSKKCLVTNMQKEPGAFDSWAIGLKANCPELVNKVEIEWDTIKEDLSSQELGNYNRFLYRAYKFKQNFPDWVKLSPEIPDSFIDNYDKNKKWVLNCPSKEASAPHPERGWEYDWECDLAKKMQENQNKFEVADHQLPVGLFMNEVSYENAVTPSGKSQIDLWSIKDSVLSIYELKKDYNRPVGIISEISFYANVMNDLKNGTINFTESINKLNEEESIRHIKALADYIKLKSISSLSAVLLANNLHSLVSGKAIDLLNTNKSGIKFSHKSVNDFNNELK